MNVGVIGLGLIGGSIARDLKAVGHTITGVDKSEKHIEMAYEIGFIDNHCDIKEVTKICDVIFLAVPVDHIESLTREILDDLKWTSVLIDVGSTKKAICESIKDHKKRSRFVAAHPLAGTEFSGPSAAIEGLFENNKNIICEEGEIDEDALEIAISFFKQMKMQSLFMDPDEHDKHMAYISHLSHVSSFMLSMTVLDIEKDSKQIVNLASTGFESTVRLAKSNPETWTSIFNKNSEHLSIALGAYIKHLEEFKDKLDEKDKTGIKNSLISANKIKRVLKGIKMNILKLS
ncbi:MAG: prephenate dehydrogenase [Saprospiraceae bacterium]